MIQRIGAGARPWIRRRLSRPGIAVALGAVMVACAGPTPAPPARAEPLQDAPAAAEADSAPAEAGPAAAAEVIRRYYAAIDARDYRRAYELWGGRGAASGQAFEEFAAGFAETAHVEVEVGRAGRVEPAAGSRYVEVPVTIRAVTRAGEQQRFHGSYTLRRTVVDGASAEQRRWHIYSASVVASRG